MKKYILSIDQGTTSTRAILINERGEAVYKAQREVECLFPHPGWVESVPDKIWISVIDVINELMVISSCTMDDVAAIGITNQRETTVVWDRHTGKAVYNAIIWQSKQTQELCDEREDQMNFIQEKTGLRMNPYFSASKIRFILDNIPEGQERAERGDLLFGTIDSWIIYKMTNGKSHFTDVTNASRTMLYNIFDMKWDPELLKIWNIPEAMLPEVKDNSDNFGEASFFQGSVPIHGVAGDQQAALFGQCCFHPGDSKNTYGTGCFMLMNIGDKPIISKKGLLTTVAWREKGVTTYALEGSVFMGGAIIQWLRDQMDMIKSSAQSEEYANRVHDTAGVYVVPAFVGLGTPYWDDEARGAVFGLTRGADRHHFVRATLFSIAYQSKDVIEAMKEEAGLELKSLRVDGGASANGLLMQFQSDILQCEVHLPRFIETTALGAGYLAGLGVDFWHSKADIERNHSIERKYYPMMPQREVNELYDGWKEAVKATRAFKPKKCICE
ncbi:MAG: glycerol kinase GlpK [Candidatus Enterosoma sp.]|nr:glycerol kinase GlpK [Bacilli bacterium]MDD7093339.1 glycerol kinase GlpK [bacterium]MDY3210655.1 glycerol kinase GlpK [Candidatus Enterosoma sp.]MDD7212751.1 glycerol kinase GlpK [bacterium]MDD7329115.1 glycerol kinase GlpK [bacterium]